MQKTSRKSWFPYILPVIILLLTLFGTYVVIVSAAHQWWLLILILTVYSIIAILRLRAFKLIIDEDGIWCSSGIFPWEKKTNGLHWRDINGANYTTGFISWISNSYEVYYLRKPNGISNYYSHIYNGKKFVDDVNQIVNQK